ncbi:MAG: polyprenyl synthetase family protein [Rhodothermales bacterium]|nr:polyprenyl synthetase family protein [Rhodothermales bacterium]
MNSVVADGSARGVQFLDQSQTEIDTAFAELKVANTPHYLYDPVHYVLENAGKRLRPVLVVLASRLRDPRSTAGFPAAIAVQLFHDFTLVHDDIMDNSDERRGRPSVFKQFDSSAAILSGDLLLCLAYTNLARTSGDTVKGRMLDVFNRMAVKVCEGQALDSELAASSAGSLQEYLLMIDGKTAALLEACLEIGGIVGGVDEGGLARLRSIGNCMGRAFQIQDDLLDIVADNSSWGKPVGGDLVEGKRSYPVLKGYELAPSAEKEWFDAYFNNGGISIDEVDSARLLLESVGAFAATRKEVEKYTGQAVSELTELPAGPARDALRAMIARLNSRSH